MTGRSFEHRKSWVEHRLLHLCELFAVELFSYVVMSNHYHAVLRLDPTAVASWTPETVARRWATLTVGTQDEVRYEARVTAIVEDAERVEVLRRRLGSLSWFMRYMNEYIARRSNAEDQCTGRFWQGRFDSYRLLDEHAVLSCMTYVDLNPSRAGLGVTPGEYRHCSARLRAESLVEDARKAHVLRTLRPLRTGTQGVSHELAISVADYLNLLVWTAKDLKSESLADAAPPFIVDHFDWRTALAGFTRKGQRAFGGRNVMRSFAEKIGQNWLRGISSAPQVPLLRLRTDP